MLNRNKINHTKIYHKTDLQKNIAWNKIALKTPSAWEIDSLDSNHILIGENESPRLEIKWTDSPNKFTLEKYLKKFIAQAQKTLNIKIHELPAPESFFHPNSNFKFFFFSWESKSSKGNGTLIFCSLCKKLTILRFFSDDSFSLNSLKVLILYSFADHPAGDEIKWEIFGMKFFIPAGFELLEYSFQPGCYTINFKNKKTIITLFSWGPALFLLKNSDLPQFAKIRIPQLKSFATTKECSLGTFLEWSYSHGLFKNSQIIPILNRYIFHTIFRICKDTQNNRILGVMVDSPHKTINFNIIKRSIISDIQESQ